MPLTIGLFGTGRLSSAIRGLADTQDDLQVAWAVGRGVSQASPSPLPSVDVAIEVSHADAVAQRLRWAASTRTPLVIGTTGWDTQLVHGAAATSQVPLLLAPNFSLGVALVRRLVAALGRYAAAAPGHIDLAVAETHHRHKADSPSGTALSLRDALAEGAGRSVTEIQTSSLRLGSVPGEHEVIAAGELESIAIRHVAHSREVFASGALTAARWLVRQPPGLHTLDDLAAESLLPLVLSTPSTTNPPEEGRR